jgi:peptidoglycan hydrolase-like protein with peptidoglycan-binding domain
LTETTTDDTSRVLFGPDASSFQGDVGWQTVDASCAFGWEKVTQGTGYVNPRWAKAKPAMAARAKASGFVPGAYLFLEAGNGAGQADYFAAWAGNLTGFAVAVDAEPTGASRPTHADAVACVARLREHYPHHPIGGYLPHWYWLGADTTYVDYLWASRYVTGTGSPAGLYAKVTADFWAGYGGRVPALLQFSSTVTVPGVAGQCDCSAFRGSPVELAALLLPAAPKPPPVPVPVPADWEEKIMQRLPEVGAGDARPWLVRRVQALANAELLTRQHGFKPIAIDGRFDAVTAATIREIQRHHKLPQTGKTDPHTWAVLVTGKP